MPSPQLIEHWTKGRKNILISTNPYRDVLWDHMSFSAAQNSPINPHLK
jgi:hypothetical protein